MLSTRTSLFLRGDVPVSVNAVGGGHDDRNALTFGGLFDDSLTVFANTADLTRLRDAITAFLAEAEAVGESMGRKAA